ncbi:MAG: iron-containing alcohol dehydrogenase [Firmicutes bacterium]|nr:iron-containing alcohol dehydrogenase [Bacillota bacterium]
MDFDYEQILAATPERLRCALTWQTAGAKPDGKILFGCGVARKCGEEAAKIVRSSGGPDRRALIVTGRNVTSIGIPDLVRAALESSGFSVDVFSDVQPEPPAETPDRVAAMLRDRGFDVVVGLGGGSALDTARAAAALVTNPGSITDYVPGGGRQFEKPGLPSIMIPTTSGSGSEVSPFFVFIVGGKKRSAGHPMLFADVALIDPILTVTMPPGVTAGTGLDALTHAVEGLTHIKAYPIGDALSVKSVELVFEYLPRATADGSDIEARYYMSWASALGMMSYSWTGGLYAHSISYVLTHHLGTGHGAGCGIALPYTLMFNIEFIREKLEYMAGAAGLQGGLPGDCGDTALAVIRRTQDLLGEVGMPRRLKEMGVKPSDVSLYAEDLVRDYPRPFNPRPMTLRGASQLFESMWDGELRPIA